MPSLSLSHLTLHNQWILEPIESDSTVRKVVIKTVGSKEKQNLSWWKKIFGSHEVKPYLGCWHHPRWANTGGVNFKEFDITDLDTPFYWEIEENGSMQRYAYSSRFDIRKQFIQPLLTISHFRASVSGQQIFHYHNVPVEGKPITHRIEERDSHP